MIFSHNRFKDTVFKSIDNLLYIFDCFTYIIIFFSLFIFISLLSTTNNATLITFDYLLKIVLYLQILRPILAFFSGKNGSFIFREISIAIVLSILFLLFFSIKSLQEKTNILLIMQFNLTIHIIFFSTYLVLTFYRVHQFLRSIRVDFFQSFTVGFIFLILGGTWLLSLPYSRTHAIPLVDLLFTATSAVTVTGLSTLDIGSDFTFFGQTVVMLLIQFGGLGIITFSTFFLINSSGRIGFDERIDSLKRFNQQEVKGLNTFLQIIILSTLLIEAIGAIFLYIGTRDMQLGRSSHIFFSIFHSVSAFCNAGFSPIASNIRVFYDHPLVVYTISGLIILGGLGFLVMMEIKNKISYFFFRRKQRVTFMFSGKKQTGSTKKPHMSLSSMIAIRMTIILVLVGTILFYYFEKDGVLSNFTTSEKISNSFFQSVTTRTAGFSSVSMVNLKESTQFLFEILMFIGAAPGSTGGGLKVTTFFILIWMIVEVFLHRQKKRVLRKRHISYDIITTAGAILFLRFAVLGIGVFILVCTQNIPLKNLIFEAISAFSTVGLTLNTTSLLDDTGKIVIILLMFIGRIGPFHIISSLLNIKEKNDVLDYPEADIPLE